MSSRFWITNPLWFYGPALLLVGYVLYVMFRNRKGERPGDQDREPEL